MIDNDYLSSIIILVIELREIAVFVLNPPSPSPTFAVKEGKCKTCFTLIFENSEFIKRLNCVLETFYIMEHDDIGLLCSIFDLNWHIIGNFLNWICLILR